MKILFYLLSAITLLGCSSDTNIAEKDAGNTTVKSNSTNPNLASVQFVNISGSTSLPNKTEQIVKLSGKRNKQVSLEQMPQTAIKLNFEKTVELQDHLKKLESCLSKKELQIVNLLLLGNTQVEISTKMGLTKGRINQMMMNIRKRMKSHTYAKQAGYVAA